MLCTDVQDCINAGKNFVVHCIEVNKFFKKQKTNKNQNKLIPKGKRRGKKKPKNLSPTMDKTEEITEMPEKE